MKIYSLLTIAFVFIALPVMADEIYKWVDSNGKVHFSDVPQARAAEKVKIKQTNLADAVEPIERVQVNNRQAKEVQDNSTAVPEISTRQQQLDKESADNEKCFRRYGVSCKALAHAQKQNAQRRNATGSQSSGGRPAEVGGRNGSRSGRNY